LLPLAAFAALGLRGLLQRPLPYTIAVFLLAAALLALNIYTIGWFLPAHFAVSS